MKNKIIKVISFFCVVTLVLCVGGYTAWRNYVPTNIEYTMTSDTTVNLYDPREVVGVKDYVFVCRVIEMYDYYSEKGSRDFPDVVDYYDLPVTECRVEIIKNIKGTLAENSVTSFYKGGGINYSRTAVILKEGDIMPEVGKYYIFTGMAHPDGTMTGGGTNGTIALEDGIDKNNLETSAIYQKYVDAYNNQIEPKNSKNDIAYFAKADKNYNDGATNAQLYEKDLRAKSEKGHTIDEKYDKALKSENPKLEEVLDNVVSERVSK